MMCYNALSTVACSFEFSNVDNEDYYLLKRNTPLEGFFYPFLAVSCDGVPVTYEGIIAYRSPPARNEFVSLKAGTSISATVLITEVFNFHSDGLYSIDYNNFLYVTKGPMELEFKIDQVEVRSVVHISLRNTHLFLKPVVLMQQHQVVEIEGCRSASFNGGNETQINDVLSAHKRLCAQFAAARNGVENNNFYKTWFGKYTVERASKVKKVLHMCEDGIMHDTVTYDMNGFYCFVPLAYAYSVVGEKAKIHLCPAFHAVPAINCQKDDIVSKEQILAHEWTHSYGGTEDYFTYGEEANKELARNDPDKAVNHADNYAYYYCQAYWQ